MLHVHVIDELRMGGAQTHLITMLREALKIPGIDHRVVCLLGDGELSGDIRRLGVPLDILDLRPHFRKRHFFSASREIQRLIEPLHPDLVEAHLTWSRLLALFAAWRAGVPLRIGFEQGDLYLTSWKFRLANFLGQWLADRIVVCSNALGEWNHRTHGVLRSKLLVLHNCVDLAQFNASGRAATDICFPEGATAFCAVGTLGRGVNKRVDVCIRGLAYARAQGANAYLVICGDGEQRAELERLAGQLEVAAYTKFLGMRRDVADVLRACHVFCHAAPFEPFGIVAIEAMAAGLPIVVPNSGGIREVVEDGLAGFVYPAMDHKSLARRMLTLSSDPELRRQMGLTARRVVEERFSVEQYVSRLYQSYGVDPTRRGGPPQQLNESYSRGGNPDVVASAEGLGRLSGASAPVVADGSAPGIGSGIAAAAKDTGRSRTLVDKVGYRLRQRTVSLLGDVGGRKLFLPVYGGQGVILILHQLRAGGELSLAPGLTFTVDFLERAIGYVQSAGWEIVSLDEMLARLESGKPAPRSVCFTFDDGYADNYTLGLSVFRRYNVPFCVYVTSGMLERKMFYWWGALEQMLLLKDSVEICVPEAELRLLRRAHPEIEVSRDGAKTSPFGGGAVAVRIKTRSFSEKVRAYSCLEGITQKYDGLGLLSEREFREVLRAHGVVPEDILDRHALTPRQLQSLAQDELVTIGSHAVSHRRLALLNAEQLKAELVDSRCTLEEYLGVSVAHFSFPFGGAEACGRREFEAAEQAGYTSAVTALQGNLFPEHRTSATSLPRRTLRPTLPELRNCLYGSMSFVEGTPAVMGIRSEVGGAAVTAENFLAGQDVANVLRKHGA
jgi:glycosyltransferase involved in cell wall biosynthesis/peptidoglycan/xylan/chitin deacetylase (PgdA/CDA1 family)